MRHRPGAALPALLFTVVVLGLSVLLVRGRASDDAPAVAYPAAAPGDETARGMTPVLRPAQLPARSSGALRVALVRDPASVRFHDDSLAYDRELDLWRRVIEATGAVVHTVAPGELAAGNADVIVVPSAPCLSPATRNAMLGRTARDQGIIFTGLTGTRDAGCRSIGYGLLASLTGATGADTLGAAASSFITLPAGTPLTLDIPPGARMELRPAPHVAVRHGGRDAYYSDRDLNPVAIGGTLLDGAVIHDAGAAQRVAYLGFELGTVVDRPWERGIVALLIRNALALAGGIPIASPEPWPAGFDAAAVIAQDVEDEFANARHAIDSLDAAGATGTFFLVSEIAAEHPDLVAEMARIGEIGTHSENHHAFGGPVGAQEARLNRTQEQLAALTGQRVRGFRPPEERFDERTLAAWREAGGTYLFGATNGRSVSPELVSVDGEPLVLVGRSADDDFLTVRRAGISDPARLAADQLDAFGKSRALGGLYVLSYHSNMLARPVTAPAIGTIARALKAEPGVWVTTMADVADWWVVRHAAEATVEQAGTNLLRLTLRNGSARPMAASTVALTLPRGGTATAASSGALEAGREGIVRVSVPRLGPGAVFRSDISLEGAGHAN